MVESVEKLSPELHGLRFLDFKRLGQRHVPIVLARAKKSAKAIATISRSPCNSLRSAKHSSLVHIARPTGEATRHSRGQTTRSGYVGVPHARAKRSQRNRAATVREDASISAVCNHESVTALNNNHSGPIPATGHDAKNSLVRAERQRPPVVDHQALWAILAIRTVHVEHGVDTRLSSSGVTHPIVNLGCRPCVCRLELNTVRKRRPHRHLQAVEFVLSCVCDRSKPS